MPTIIIYGLVILGLIFLIPLIGRTIFGIAFRWRQMNISLERENAERDARLERIAREAVEEGLLPGEHTDWIVEKGRIQRRKT